MTLPRLFFNVLVAISLFSCKPTRFTMTPAQEFKQKAPDYARTDRFLDSLVRASPGLAPVLADPEKRVQVIYTQVDRQKNNKPTFTNYYFHVQPDRYFYPASTVKLPTAILALQRLNELKIRELDKETTMVTKAAFSGQTPVYNDPTSPDGRPTVSHYIKKILLVSDNDAYNRLYEFLGQEYINNTLHNMGYDSVQIIHRLDIVLSEDQNRTTNPVLFYDTASRVVYQQPLVKSALTYHPRQIRMGKGFLRNGQLVEEPFDFSRKNRLSLVDLHSILMSIIFPKAVPKAERFKLKKEDYQFLRRYMSMLPRESAFPQYDSTAYPDAFVKFLLYGGGPISDSSIRIFNKVGDAYGFLTETAYVVDFKNGVEFFLSVTVYCNSDGIFNDDHYDYKTVGLPFMKSLGQALYDFELQRKRKHQPDLSEFQFSYREE